MGYYQKYIDSEKLKAEIERLLKCTESHRGEAVADGSRQTLYWIKDFIVAHQQQEPKDRWKPSEEQIGALNYAYYELFKREDVGHNILGPLQNLIDTLSKL